jgi:predicted YcjX-like family ATPase
MPERRIGVIGLQGSGKTVLLTSLINHLMHHDPRRFPIQGGAVRITHFSQEPPDEGWSQFEYTKARRALARPDWPAKTLESSQYKCRFRWNGEGAATGLAFYDLPGERFADIFMYDSDYEGWSTAALDRLEATGQFGEFERTRRAEHVSDAARRDLLDQFKLGLARLVAEDPAIVSPSTLYLDREGGTIKYPRRFRREDLPRELRALHVDSVAALTRTTYYHDGGEIIRLDERGEEVVCHDLEGEGRPRPELFVRSPRDLTRATFHIDDDGRIHYLGEDGEPVRLAAAIRKRGRNRPPGYLLDYLLGKSIEDRYVGLSDDSQFVPLPATFRDRSEAHLRLWKEFESHYREYQDQVVAPLFRAIKECNALLVVVDVLHTLANRELLNTTHKLLTSMTRRLDPGQGSDWGTRLVRQVADVFAKFVRPNYIDKIAFVVPKMDLVYKEDRAQLEALGRAFVEGSGRDVEGVEMRLFTCSAVDSQRAFFSEDGRAYVAYKASQVAPWHLPVGDDGRVLPGPFQMPVSRLPQSPDPRTWEEEYYFPYALLPETSLVEKEPPPHSNLDKVFSFLAR